MKLLAPILRVAAEVGGVFLILAATADKFDATEIAALIGIASVLVTVEIVVAFLRNPRSANRSGSAQVSVLALLAFLGLAFVREPQPKYAPSHVAQANIAAILNLYG